MVRFVESERNIYYHIQWKKRMLAKLARNGPEGRRLGFRRRKSSFSLFILSLAPLPRNPFGFFSLFFVLPFLHKADRSFYGETRKILGVLVVKEGEKVASLYFLVFRVFLGRFRCIESCPRLSWILVLQFCPTKQVYVRDTTDRDNDAGTIQQKGAYEDR